MNSAPTPFLQPSPLERFFNRLFGVFVGWGIGPSYNYLLQVQGQKSGRISSTPVNVLDRQGNRLLGPTRRDAMGAKCPRERPSVVEARAKSSDRKSTRLNSSHLVISYAVFCLKKKKSKH